VLCPMRPGAPVDADGCGGGSILHAGPSWGPQAPAAAGRVACASPHWHQRVCQGAAWRPRHRGHGRGGHCVLPQRLFGGGACGGDRWRRSAPAGRAVPSRTRHASRGHGAAGRSCGARWGAHSPPLCLVRPHPRSPKAHRRVQPPAARMVPTWAAVGGHREARTPASVPSNPTRACRRRPTASAPASLRLLGAPDA